MSPPLDPTFLVTWRTWYAKTELYSDFEVWGAGITYSLSGVLLRRC